METKHPGEQLLNALLHAFAKGPEAVTELFADNATIEFPYAPSIGGESRFDKPAYHTYLQGILPDMPAITFANLRVYPLAEPGAYWAEFDGETTVPSTGKPYQQAYVVYFKLIDNQFLTYREYWNPLPFLRAYDRLDDVKSN